LDSASISFALILVCTFSISSPVTGSPVSPKPNLRPQSDSVSTSVDIVYVVLISSCPLSSNGPVLFHQTLFYSDLKGMENQFEMGQKIRGDLRIRSIKHRRQKRAWRAGIKHMDHLERSRGRSRTP